jgi:hypothetical protein
MFNAILRIMFGRRAPEPAPGNDEVLLNYSLDLAQEWGESWLKPIQTRLGKAYPKMEQTELDRLNAAAQAAMKFGHDLVYLLSEKQGRENVSEQEWRKEVSSRYPWIDEKNLRHLFSTGQYYAWKEFE